MITQVKPNLIRETKTERAKQIWTAEFSLTRYSSGGRFIMISSLGKYHFEIFRGVNSAEIVTDEWDVTLVDGTHMDTILKKYFIYKRNEHVSDFGYAQKDGRVMNDEYIMII